MSIAPLLYDHVEVTVTGQPGASKKQLYWLAMSAAMGVARRFDFLNAFLKGVFIDPPPGAMIIDYDAASNWVKCTIDYTFSTIEIFSPTIGGGRNRTWASAEVFQGPSCDVVGDAFTFTGTGFGVDSVGIPASSAVEDGAPQLPFRFRTVVTECPEVPDPNPALPVGINIAGVQVVPGPPIIPSPNPKPPGDNRSRGAIMRPGIAGSTDQDKFLGKDECCYVHSELIPLVFAALTFPGSLSQEEFVPPVLGPLGG